MLFYLNDKDEQTNIKKSKSYNFGWIFSNKFLDTLLNPMLQWHAPEGIRGGNISPEY